MWNKRNTKTKLKQTDEKMKKKKRNQKAKTTKRHTTRQWQENGHNNIKTSTAKCSLCKRIFFVQITGWGQTLTSIIAFCKLIQMKMNYAISNCLAFSNPLNKRLQITALTFFLKILFFCVCVHNLNSTNIDKYADQLWSKRKRHTHKSLKQN